MKVTGKVTDINGESLPLANITITSGINANKIGVVADSDGDFIFDNQVITPDTKITVSYVGYKPQEFTAEALNNKTVKLSEQAEILDEVVIRPDSTKPKSKNNDIASVSAKTKQKFLSHLNEHKAVYASIGGLVGLSLIFFSIKKMR